MLYQINAVISKVHGNDDYNVRNKAWSVTNST
jgi:hypothetical protein